MIRFFETHVPQEACEWPAGSGGMFLWVRVMTETHPDIETLEPEAIVERLFQRCIEQLVLVAPSHFFKTPGGKRWTKEEESKRMFLRLCYGTATTEQMEEGVKRLARALRVEWQLS